MNATAIVAEPTRTKVTVYRDHPEFNSSKPWFMIPWPILRELLVAEYSVCDERFDKGVKQIESAHPDCVLIYAHP